MILRYPPISHQDKGLMPVQINSQQKDVPEAEDL